MVKKDGNGGSGFLNFLKENVMESKMLLNAVLLPASHHAQLDI